MLHAVVSTVALRNSDPEVMASDGLLVCSETVHFYTLVRTPAVQITF